MQVRSWGLEDNPNGGAAHSYPSSLSDGAGLMKWPRKARRAGSANARHDTSVDGGVPDNRDGSARTWPQDIPRRLELIEARLQEVQGLAAQTYETLADWPSLLERVRRSAGYSAAFDKSEPLVSVRIATFNGSHTLVDRAIGSLLGQTYDRWECIVVGDACTDDTERLVRAIGDPRVSFTNLSVRAPYPDEPKQRWYVAGIPAMNEGARRASGEWIAPLDHDDEWEPDHISELLLHAQKTRSEVVYGRIRTIDVRDGSAGEMGAWPPVRGQFGFLGSIYHAGLTRFPYDPNCRFADEPGDWNLARRWWEAGVRFSFLDRIVATHFHTPRHASLSQEQLLIAELRDWCRQLEEARDHWRARAEAAEADLSRHGNR